MVKVFSAKGDKHWAWQRFSAIVLVPLSAWLLFVLARASARGWERADFVEWLHPVRLAALSLWLVLALWHGRLGVHVVVEDYVHGKEAKLALLLVLDVIFVVSLVLGLWAFLSLSLESFLGVV